MENQWELEGQEQPQGDRRRMAVWILLGIMLFMILTGTAAGLLWHWSLLKEAQSSQLQENPADQENPSHEMTVGTAPSTEEASGQTELPEPLQRDTRRNILLIGQDAREGEEAKLADTILLFTLNPETDTLTLTSFLRDMYLKMPDYKGHICGENRINAVYALGWQWGGEQGGMEMMDQCLLETFGIQVDYNVEVGFETFYAIIDALGGVDIALTEAEAAYLRKDTTGMNDGVHAGPNHMIGYTALCYARIRKLDGDVQRTARQRKVVQAVMEKCRKMRLPELLKFAGTVAPLVTTDMSGREITELLGLVISMLPDFRVETGICPAEGTFWGETVTIGGSPANVLKFDPEPNRKWLTELCEPPETLKAE